MTILWGCVDTSKKRPFGVVRLGKIEDLRRPESILSSEALIVRYDNQGFSAMSLLCTHDLAPLKIVNENDKQFLQSPYSASRYNLDGALVAGPAKNNLPFYELMVAPGEYGGAPDTLYAKIGKEVSPAWRLQGF